MVLAIREAIELDYEVHGEGDPIVFIAGTNDDRNGWAEVAPAFPNHRRILFDNRDVGLSPRAISPYTTADMALDTLAMMDRAGVQRAHVFGHSMGGTIAQELALLAPERVRSLVLIGTFPKPDHYLANALQRWMAWIRTLTTDEFLRNTIPYWVGSETINSVGIEELVALITPQVEAQGPEAFCRQVEAVLAHDASGRVSRITAPALIVAGDGDMLVRENHEHALVDGIPDSYFTVIKDSGHSPTIEQPEQLNAAIRAFLASL